MAIAPVFPWQQGTYRIFVLSVSFSVVSCNAPSVFIWRRRKEREEKRGRGEREGGGREREGRERGRGEREGGEREGGEREREREGGRDEQILTQLLHISQFTAHSNSNTTSM